MENKNTENKTYVEFGNLMDGLMNAFNQYGIYEAKITLDLKSDAYIKLSQGYLSLTDKELNNEFDFGRFNYRVNDIKVQ